MTQHLKPRSTTVTLYQGDDMDRLAHLRRTADAAERRLKSLEAAAAEAADTARAGDDTGEEIVAARAAVETARDAFDAFVDDAAGRALSVELQDIGLRRFTDLLAANPPRMVEVEVEAERALGEAEAPVVSGPKMVIHEDDAAWKVNTETFPKALLTYRDGNRVTIAQPEFGNAAAVTAFVEDELAEGDFEQIWHAAYFLNRSPSADPFSLRYSTVSPSTDET